jgi:hypothetical protein
MSQVGHPVSNPTGGLYCQVRLDSGDRLLVNHDKTSLDSGQLTIERLKWLGFGSEPIFTLDLATAQGRAALGRLTGAAAAGSGAATPIGALCDYIKGCRNLEEVRQRCEALTAAARAAA